MDTENTETNIVPSITTSMNGGRRYGSTQNPLNVSSDSKVADRLRSQLVEPVTFGAFVIDPIDAVLLRNNISLSLTPKAFSVLHCLVQSAGNLLTRDELFDKVWPGVIVTDAALTVCIREIRAVLQDDVKNPTYIETVPKRGYRFICETSSQMCYAGSADNYANFVDQDLVVGRELALGVLNDCLQKANLGHRQFVFINGEPGIGKTTLVNAFIQLNINDCHLWTASGQCIEHFSATEAYSPILDAMGDLARQQGDAFTEILGCHAPTWLEHIPEIEDAANRRASTKKSQTGLQHSMLRELTSALESATSNRLLILVFEDLHWCDRSSVDLLSFLARRSSPARLLIIGTYRSIDAATVNHSIAAVNHDLHQRQLCVTVPLDFLDRHLVGLYLARTFPNHEFPQEFVTMVHEQSEGNPLFMLNVINYLSNTGFIKKADQKWVLTGPVADLNHCLPDDLKLMIMRQIERLDPDTQKLLEAASVAGYPGGVATRFTQTEVAEVLEMEMLEAENRLEDLARSGHFLRSSGESEWPDGSFSNRYEFTHVMYQKVLYSRVSTYRRSQIHRQLGLRLEQGYQDSHNEIANRLAVHFEEGRDYWRTVKYLKLLAQTVAERGAGREALHTVTKALSLIEKLTPSEERDRMELSLLLIKAPVITISHGNAAPEIEDCYQRAGQLCEKLGEKAEQFRVLFGLRSLYTIRGDLQKAKQLAQFLFQLSEQLDDSGYLLEAEVGLASSLFFTGNHRASYKHALRGIALYDKQRHEGHAALYGLDPGVFCYARVGQTLWTLGFPDQALDYELRALALAESLDHPYSLVFAIHNLTLVHLYRCDGEAALPSAKRGTELALKFGFSFLTAWAYHLRAWTYALVGDTNRANEDITRAMQTERPDAPAADSYLSVFLAESYRLVGNIADGQSILASPSREHCYDIQRQYLQAELMVLESDKGSQRDCAEELFEAACRNARKQGMKAYELRVSIGLSQLYFKQQRYTEAYDCLREITGWFTEGLDTYEVRQAQCLLENLSTRLKQQKKGSNVVYLNAGTDAV